MPRPDYCPDLKEDEDCPACGATVKGDDPVRGICQARFNGPTPKPLLEFVLIDKRDGEIVARQRVL